MYVIKEQELDVAGVVPPDTQPDDEEEEQDGEQGAAARQPANPKDTACRVCGTCYTKRGVKKHENKCLKKKKDLQVSRMVVTIVCHY